MASIPLPALDIRPAAPPPDALEQYGRLMALKQQAANAPLQTQALQQQVAAGGLENQQRQQQLADEQAKTAAMSEWDGKDYNDIYPLILKHGGSATAVLGLKKAALDQQTQIATAAKDNAQAASDNVTATMKKNDIVTGSLSPLIDPKQTPDQQLPQALQSTVQGLVQQGVLDPGRAQAASQLLQSGDPNAIRQGIDHFSKTLMAQSQITEQAAKHAGILKDQAQAEEAQLAIDYYRQHGGAPGVPLEAQQQADWLAKNPGKGPADFVAWKAKQAPLAQLAIMNNTGAGQPAAQIAKQFGMTPEAYDQAAERFASTGELPPSGRGGPALAKNQAIMNRAAELHPGQSLAANSAEYKANTESLKKLQSSLDNVSAFEGTANKNIEMLENIAKNVPDLGVKFANVPVRMLTGSMIGTDNMAAFKTALAPVQTEAAKILNSANLAGSLSDSSRHELQDLVNGDLKYSALVSSLKVLQQDFANRKESTQAQIGEIQKRLGGQPQSQNVATPKPVGTTNKPDGVYQMNGKQYTVKGGQVYE